MTQPLPTPASLEQLRKRAKDLRRAFAAGDAEAAARVRAVPECARLESPAKFPLALAQLVIAREHGFESWPKLKRHVELASSSVDGRSALLIDAALNGDLTKALALIESDPTLATSSLHAACVAGEAAAAIGFLAADPHLARAKGGPKQREPLLYVAFSRLLGADARRADGLLAIARALLAHGADPNAFYATSENPKSRQTPLYGAAGVNRHAGLTKLLLDAGADPGDGPADSGTESLYHACESPDLACLRLILEARPDRDKVSYCLARKLDFEDFDGAQLMLDHGADPNFTTPHSERWTRLHHAIARGRSVRILELLLDRGADPNALDGSGRTSYALAVQQGREDAAALLLARGARTELSARDRFLGACSRGDEAAAREALKAQPDLLASLTVDEQGTLTAAAWAGNAGALRAMLALGFDPAWTNAHGATALHAAAFRGDVAMVSLLLELRPNLDHRDRVYDGTPLGWALEGSRNAEASNPTGDHVAVVEALLRAGAIPSKKPGGSASVQAAMRRFHRK